MLIHNSCIKTSAIKTNSFHAKGGNFPLFFRITRQTRIQIRRKLHENTSKIYHLQKQMLSKNKLKKKISKQTTH